MNREILWTLCWTSLFLGNVSSLLLYVSQIILSEWSRSVAWLRLKLLSLLMTIPGLALFAYFVAHSGINLVDSFAAGYHFSSNQWFNLAIWIGAAASIIGFLSGLVELVYRRRMIRLAILEKQKRGIEESESTPKVLSALVAGNGKQKNTSVNERQNSGCWVLFVAVILLAVGAIIVGVWTFMSVKIDVDDARVLLQDEVDTNLDLRGSVVNVQITSENCSQVSLGVRCNLEVAFRIDGELATGWCTYRYGLSTERACGIYSNH